MKIGVSLSPEILIGCPVKEEEQKLLDFYHGTAGLLSEIKRRGVTHIELRAVKPEYHSDQAMAAVEAVWSQGLHVTIHGKLVDSEELISFEKAYPSLEQVLHHFRRYQDELILVVHAFTSPHVSQENLAKETVRVLSRWISMLGSLPVKFAVEINRAKGGRFDPCTRYEGVLDIVKELEGSAFGICWDMGHVYYNILNGLIPENVPENFLKKVIHTHIHGLGEKGTHCTLTPDHSLPLREYVDALRKLEYNGVYNLELSLEKFPIDTVVTEFFGSIDKLVRVLGS